LARRVVRTAVVVALVALGALLVIAAAFHVYESEPMDDMRQRADALPLPSDFVLASESYSPGAMGFFGAVPHLERVYHASWPGLCDSLLDLGSHLDGPSGLAPVPRQYANDMCNCGALYRSGWWSWIRNYRRYEVRLTAWRPGSAEGPQWDTPHGFIVLFPRPDRVPDSRIVIPPGRGRVAVELIAHRGW
jgi:hypothetical protein